MRDYSGATTIGLSYDVQGNLANRNGQLHTFDFGNRLREVPGIERCRYDAHGRRVTATDANGQRLFSLYGSDGTLLHEQRRDRGTIDYIHLGKRLLATRSNGVVTWQHNDALGSPVVTTNGAGAVVERRQFEPYGASVGAATDGVGYTGHVMDAGTGLTYMQQRYMDPVLGVFLSVDPVTAYGNPVVQFNRYRYGNSNPFTLSDPDGMQAACGKDTGCRIDRGEWGGSAKSAGGSRAPSEPAQQSRIHRIVNEAESRTAGLRKRDFGSAGVAARAWLDAVRPVSDKHGAEIGVRIFESLSGGALLGNPVSDGLYDELQAQTIHGSVSGLGDMYAAIGYAHTHPANRFFSGADLQIGRLMSERQNEGRIRPIDFQVFVGLSNGLVWGWSHQKEKISGKTAEAYSSH